MTGRTSHVRGMLLASTVLVLQSTLTVRVAQDGAQGPAAGRRLTHGAAHASGSDRPSNLRVVPQDIAQQELLATMRAFNEALGVECWYCHADATVSRNPNGPLLGEPARRGGPLDYASDAKPPKNVARSMMAMVRESNAILERALGRSSATRVTCITCHRGTLDPRPLLVILEQAMNEKGQGYALSRYRNLRTRYAGAEAYDFAEPVLIELARVALIAGKVDDAVAWLQLNVEFYPKSAASYTMLSQVHVRKGDTASAIRHAERALEIDPTNQGARRQLATLKH